MILAAAFLGLAAPARSQSPPPRVAWYETLGKAVGLAEEQPAEIVNQARRQRAADALRAAGADPVDCEQLERLKPGESVSAGFPILDQCVVYNHPGTIRQPGVKWNTGALVFLGAVALALFLGGAAAFWLIRERRATRNLEFGRPGDIPKNRISRPPQPKVRILPSRVRIRLRMPW